MATRPVSDDSKEAQANTAAVIALGKIGDRQGVAALRHVLTSDEWTDDDIQWDAAEALGQIVGEPFADGEKPILAAREWLMIIRKRDPRPIHDESPLPQRYLPGRLDADQNRNFVAK